MAAPPPRPRRAVPRPPGARVEPAGEVVPAARARPAAPVGPDAPVGPATRTPRTHRRTQSRRGPGRAGSAWACLTAAVVLPLVLLAAVGAEEVPRPASASVAVPSPRPSATPSAAAVVQRGDGRPVVVAGGSARSGTGPLRRYTVAVEGGLGVDAVSFARAVDRTLADARSWGAGGRLSFQRVASGPVAFRVVLASPDTTDRLCRPLDTAGRYSCGNGDTAVLNLRRWLRGADAYAGDLAGYRQYVVNHEVGHTLGHGHRSCPGAGRPAPVMVQQTKGVGACRPNPWPYP